MDSTFTLIDEQSREYSVTLNRSTQEIVVDRDMEPKLVEELKSLCHMILHENACRFHVEELMFNNLKEIIQDKFYISDVQIGYIIIYDTEMYYISNMVKFHIQHKDYTLETSLGKIKEVDSETMMIEFDSGHVLPLFFIPEYLNNLNISPMNVFPNQYPFPMKELDDLSYSILNYSGQRDGMLILKVDDNLYSCTVSSLVGLDKEKAMFIMSSLLPNNNTIYDNLDKIINVIYAEFK